MSTESKPLDGGCTCRFVRLRLTSAPLFVHCCHCRWCQRESGSAFALNAMIEADPVPLLTGEADVVDTPSQSGRGRSSRAARVAGSRCGATMPAVPGYYKASERWPASSLARRAALSSRPQAT